MAKLEKLSIEELSGITSNNVEEFKEEFGNLKLSVNDIEGLIEAEKSGKNRKQVISFLENQLFVKKVEEKLDIARDDSKEIKQLIKSIESLEDAEYFREKKIELDQDILIKLTSGTVEEMKKFISDNELTENQLKNILDGEKKAKNRKTAKKLLKNKIKDQKIGESVEKARKDLKLLEKDLEKIGNRNKSGKEAKEKFAEYLNVSEELITAAPIDKVEEIVEEKRRRENMIAQIVEKTGEGREKLKKASTSDLEKILEELK